MKKLAVIVAMLAILVSPALSQNPADKKGEKGPGGQKRLELTDEQTQKLDAIRLETEKAQIMLRAEVEIMEKDLQHQLKQEKVDKAAVDKLISELAALHGKMLRLRVDSLLKTKEILTPEQFKKYLARKGMQEKMRQGGKRAGGNRRR